MGVWSMNDQWDASADWYDQNMGEEGDALNREVLRPLVFELLGATSGQRLLDCGCGSGYLTAELATRCGAVVGTDLSPRFLEVCRRRAAGRGRLDLVRHDLATGLPFASGSFDAVLCKMVLQYVPEIGGFARESLRVLRPGGRLLVAVDHPFHALYAFAQHRAGRPSPKFPEPRDYFDERAQTKLSLWGKVELTFYPRTLSAYLVVFRHAGFRLQDLRELPDPRDEARVPRILALRFDKGA
jgi:SAM-dependent methyltransferase